MSSGRVIIGTKFRRGSIRSVPFSDPESQPIAVILWHENAPPAVP